MKRFKPKIVGHKQTVRKSIRGASKFVRRATRGNYGNDVARSDREILKRLIINGYSYKIAFTAFNR